MSTLLNWQCFTLLFCSIYINIAQTVANNWKIKIFFFAFKQKKNLQTARTLATFQALQHLPAFYQQHMLYSEPVAGQWLIAHQFTMQQFNINII
jgi:hypothetical protein